MLVEVTLINRNVHNF